MRAYESAQGLLAVVQDRKSLAWLTLLTNNKMHGHILTSNKPPFRERHAAPSVVCRWELSGAALEGIGLATQILLILKKDSSKTKLLLWLLSISCCHVCMFGSAMVAMVLLSLRGRTC